MGRVGSTLFNHLLNQTSDIYAEGEILSRRVIDLKSFILYRAIKARKPIYSFRVKHYQINRIQAMSDLSFIKQVEGLSVKWIYIERLNLKRVALSSEIAKRSNRYQSTAKVAHSIFMVPLQSLQEEYEYRIIEKEKEKRFLELISSLLIHIKYEHDLLNLEYQQNTIDAVCSKLKINPPTASPRIEKLSTSYETFIENYQEIKESFLDR
jgi:hypothetical protein